MLNDACVQFGPALLTMSSLLAKDLKCLQLLAVQLQQRLEIDQFLAHE